jgi:hypothetical protein
MRTRTAGGKELITPGLMNKSAKLLFLGLDNAGKTVSIPLFLPDHTLASLSLGGSRSIGH